MEMMFAPDIHPLVPIHGSDQQFYVHRIYCVGRNYAEHAKEMGGTGREAPFFFMKPADAVLPVATGATGDMPYPAKTKNLHHEIELVVAIGKSGSEIPADQALQHIWGYAIGLDMTRRDLQAESKQHGRPWCTAKGFDFSAPISEIYPCSATSLLPDADISLLVNGAVRQQGQLDQMIWSIPEIISELSQYYHLQAGDLIFTGTPSGVAAVSQGDILEGRIDGLGELRVQIV